MGSRYERYPRSENIRTQFDVDLMFYEGASHRYPILDNLVDIIGTDVRFQLEKLAKEYFKHPSIPHPQHKPFVIIVSGIPGSGKTTLIEELSSMFGFYGYEINNVDYEQAFLSSKPIHKKDMDSKGWIKVNRKLCDQVRNFFMGERPGPAVCLVEVPGIAERIPERKSVYVDTEGDTVITTGEEIEKMYNRDRGVSLFMALASSIGYKHVYVLSLTSDNFTQNKAIEEREEILMENAPDEVKQKVSHMARREHLEKMIAELESHIQQLMPSLQREPLNTILSLRQVTKKDRKHRTKKYEYELGVLLKMLTAYHWLTLLDVPSERIIAAHNPYNQDLTGRHKKKYRRE